MKKVVQDGFGSICVFVKKEGLIMENTGLTHKLYESPTRERNEDKYGTTVGNQCICCMKPMKDGETKWVHMNTDWLAVDISVSEENCRELTGADSQGCFNIGNDCAKKMPKNFILSDINGKDK